MNRQWLLIAAMAIAFIAKMSLAIPTYGTNDALTWEADVAKIRSDGALALYRDGAVPRHGGREFDVQQFSHPPFMVRIISVWGWLAGLTGIPVRFWIRLTCSLADIVSVILLLRILGALQTRLSSVSVLLTIISPVAILISGFHVNTDPIMITFVLFSIYLIQQGSPAWMAGCAMGMAMNTKIVPVLFIPAVCMCFRDWKKTFAFATGVGVVSAAGSIPEILQDPLLIWNSLSGYSSTPRMWGFSRLSWALLPDNLYALYSHSMKPIMLSALVGLSVWMNWRKSVPLIFQVACVAFLSLCLMPGFGVQYLAWLVPWTALLSTRQAIIFHSLSGLFLVLFYHRASRGLWYFANTFDTPVWGGTVVYLGLLLWLAICVITVMLATRIQGNYQLGNSRGQKEEHGITAYSSSAS